MLKSIKEAIHSALQVICGLVPDSIELRRPPNPEWGDLGINLLPFAKASGLSPGVIAQRLTAVLGSESRIVAITPLQNYLNFRFQTNALFQSAVDVAAEKDARLPDPQRIMVEYVSPNTNKPLHLGHLRNGALGSSLANILEAVGHQVVRANLVNDRGVHICKSMLAWQRFADCATPQSADKKGDHFVGEWYVRFAQEVRNDASLEQGVTQMLRKWEEGDPETLRLWREMNTWVYEGFAETYTRYGFQFQKTYYESDLYRLGKDIIANGLERGVFERNEDGGVLFMLDEDTFGLNADGTRKVATLLRRDGTSVYLTQDIGTAIKKVEDFAIDRSIYVVGSEQKHHFQVLFAVLRALGYEWAPKCSHLSYGMVELPSGKMKSREGTVVDADDLADEMARLAQVAIREKHRDKVLAQEEMANRAEKIALAAIKFYLLRFDPQKIIRFDPQKTLSFEGDTGPYCLYAFVRIQSILQRAEARGWSTSVFTAEFEKLDEVEERTLALDLLELPEAIQRAAKNYDPSALAEHMLRVARSFNQFYARYPVIGSDSELARQRLVLIQAVAEGLRWGLSLLGIEVISSM